MVMSVDSLHDAGNIIGFTTNNHLTPQGKPRLCLYTLGANTRSPLERSVNVVIKPQKPDVQTRFFLPIER